MTLEGLNTTRQPRAGCIVAMYLYLHSPETPRIQPLSLSAPETSLLIARG